MTELLLHLAQRNSLANLIDRGTVAEIPSIGWPQPLAIEDLHASSQCVASNEPPSLLVTHRLPMTLPRAEEGAGRGHAGVPGQGAQGAEQVGIDVDQLAALLASALLRLLRAMAPSASTKSHARRCSTSWTRPPVCQSVSRSSRCVVVSAALIIARACSRVT